MAKSGNGGISPIGFLGALLIAVFGIALCTGNKGKDTPTPAPTPSVTISEYPLQTAIQP